uniref:Granulins domain-containing protein n=1 Tax=Nothobranchius furzeri TaxID=105023 RepID=A0A8C6Q2N9_NOTFU
VKGSLDCGPLHGIMGKCLDVKCDNKSSCASGTTCCRLPSGEWGCCPLVKAVCCDDHEHCCPQGYSCNMKTSTCEKKVDSLLLTTLPQSEVVRSKPREAEDDGDVSCDSTGVFHCSKQETCCKRRSSMWTGLELRILASRSDLSTLGLNEA